MTEVIRFFSGSIGMGLPADAWIDEEAEQDEPDVNEHPGAKLIRETFAKYPDIDLEHQLRYLGMYGFDVTDPDVIQKAIDYCIAFQYAERPDDPPGLSREEWAAQTGHVVYYMRIGNRIKIGTSGNLRRRLETINPEELITVERGGVDKEQQRHREFASLRMNGEWFRMEEPLMSHVRGLVDRFKDDFGMTLYQYTEGHRLVTGLTCETTRSRIRSA